MLLSNHRPPTLLLSVTLCCFGVLCSNIITCTPYYHYVLSFWCLNEHWHVFIRFSYSLYSQLVILCCVCNHCQFCSCVVGLWFWCCWCPLVGHHSLRVRSCEMWKGTSKFIKPQISFQDEFYIYYLFASHMFLIFVMINLGAIGRKDVIIYAYIMTSCYIYT